MDTKDNDFGRLYCDKVCEKINEIIESRGLKQKEIVQLCEKAGAPISQPTVSNIKHRSTKITLSSLISICKGLEVDFFDILPGIGGKEKKIEEIDKDKKVDENLIKAYNGYGGEYHVYFFPTISNKNELLHGILHLDYLTEDGVSNAYMTLYTGEIKEVEGKSVEVIKEYKGNFVISIPMQSGYCFLQNQQTNEQCFFVFHHWYIFNNDLKCRVAAAATTSAGGNRRPTIHRIYLCRNELKVDEQRYIRGQLRLNESEILISKENYDRLLSEEDIPEEFCEIFKQEAKIDSYYSVTETKLINCKILKKDFAQAISLLRDYSVAPKYNKVSMKTDEFVFDNFYNLDDDYDKQ